MNCITLDTSKWTQEQKNLLIAVVIELLYDIGIEEIPVIKGDSVCFELFNGDLKDILDEEKILARLARDDADRERARQEAEVKEAIKRQDFTDFDQALESAKDLDELKQVLKKIIGYLIRQ